MTPRILSVAAFTLLPQLCIAGVCDITWDGDKLAENTRGRALAAPMRLLDKDKNVNAELTVAQLAAFHEAKESISRQVDRSPSYVICDSKEPNAFATKGTNGDVIGVTVGMLKLADGDRDMAAIVIGHEYAHHIKDHASEGQRNDAIIGILGGILGAVLEYKMQQRTGVTNVGANVAQIGTTLVSRKFSRDQEREADELGFGYMVDAGFNPKGAIRLAQKMNVVSNSSGLFFDSHPGWGERNTRFQTFITNSAVAQSVIARTGESTALLARASGGQSSVQTAAASYTITTAQRSFNSGVAAWRRNDFREAALELTSAAEAGHASAQALVGFMYAEGKGGLPKDETKAVEFYRKASDQGNALAQNNLGFAYASGRGGLPKDDAKALELIQKSAEQGNAAGQNSLGFFYSTGRGGLPKDDTKALEFYRKAADQGNTMGQTNMGLFYAAGRGGLPRDDAKALEYFRKAADQGNANAQNNVGFFYFTGRGGLTKDDQQARSWLQKSADQGNELAKTTLKKLEQQQSTTQSQANASPAGTSENAQDVQRKFTELWNAKDFSGLVKLGEEHSTSAPNSYLGWYMAGIGYWGTGVESKSIVYFKEAIRLRPELPDVLGKSLVARGEKKLLEAFVNIYTKIDPDRAATFKEKYYAQN